MSKNGFEFSAFRRPVVRVEYKPHPSVKDGEGVQLELNLDLVTLEVMEGIEEEFNRIFADHQEPAERSGKRFRADVEVSDDDNDGVVDDAPRINLYSYERALFAMRATLLAGKPGSDDPNERFIYSWNVVKKGKPVPVSYETLVGMPATTVADLYNFVTSTANNPTDKEKKA